MERLDFHRQFMLLYFVYFRSLLFKVWQRNDLFVFDVFFLLWSCWYCWPLLLRFYKGFIFALGIGCIVDHCWFKVCQRGGWSFCGLKFDKGEVCVMDVKGLIEEMFVLWMLKVWQRSGLCCGCLMFDGGEVCVVVV